MAQADEEDQKEKARKDYADFLEKVKKTVFIDNISPKATTSVVESGLQQFGNVVNVEFMPNYMIPYNIPQCALVEMEDQKQALKAIDAMTNYPFMMGGMPRPVRVTAAKVEMFCDRPAPPDRRKIRFRWMQPTDPHFHAMKKFRWLARRHTAESLAMIKHLLASDEELAKQQKKMLEANYEKLDLTEKHKRSLRRLTQLYGIDVDEE
ncbi:uncharacterized protein LOC109722798 isoform X2 [Ananas comosus]|nr:uncharacterized protein LOC109722798 isoform X2 [Ananas comosus]XP_020106533.1 uncharacterized protein LOC109722798 isoform X2 [Ananas comosus]